MYFVTKPNIVEAIQYDGNNKDELFKFIKEHDREDKYKNQLYVDQNDRLIFKYYLGAEHIIESGDYLVYAGWYLSPESKADFENHHVNIPEDSETLEFSIPDYARIKKKSHILPPDFKIHAAICLHP